jgi:4-oxalocrotonate tautomerase family enzyme
MPWITVNLMEGHSKEQKADLHLSVAQAVSKSLGLPEEYVRIQLVEMTGENHSIAGKMMEK